MLPDFKFEYISNKRKHLYYYFLGCYLYSLLTDFVRNVRTCCSPFVPDQLAKPTFRSRYTHTQFTEQSEGAMDKVASTFVHFHNRMSKTLIKCQSFCTLLQIFSFASAHIEGVELTNVGQAFDNGKVFRFLHVFL